MTDLQTELAALIADALVDSEDVAEYLAERLVSAFEQVGWRDIGTGRMWKYADHVDASNSEPVYRFARPASGELKESNE